jgi:hypothetical protein
MDMIDPKPIVSPISGHMIRPRLRTYVSEGKEIVEAEYYDTASGEFIRRGTVSIKDIVKTKNS